MTTVDDVGAGEAARRAQQRAVWALGDYPTVAAEVIPDLGAVLVGACGVQAHHRVLDVAAGSGNAAIPGAAAGARVTACDLAPELFEAGRRQASAHGVTVEWREGDAQALPFADGEFDVVLSCVGVMFAPRHQVAADELVRVCRPGGTIGLVNWTPQGFIGEMLATMRPYVAPPPAGARPASLWGSEPHVLALLGDRVEDVTTVRKVVTVDRFATPEAFRDYFKSLYGPMIAAYRALADEPTRAAALDRDLADLVRRFDRGAATTVMDWEYLLLVARRRS